MSVTVEGLLKEDAKRIELDVLMKRIFAATEQHLKAEDE